MQRGAVIGTDRITTSFPSQTFSAIARTSNRIGPVPDSELYKWIKLSHLVRLVDVQMVASRQVLLPGRINFLIQLKSEHAKYFTLLNGLFELGVSSAVSVEADKVRKRFVVTTSITNDIEAMSHLNTVFKLLQQEVEFRNTLRKIRVKEEQYSRELKQLYQTQILTA